MPAAVVNGGGDRFWKWKEFKLWRACDLDLRSGHTAYRPAAVIDLYLYTNFHSNWRNFLWTDGRTDGRTYGRTDVRTDGRTDIFPLYTIRSTFGSRPNNAEQTAIQTVPAEPPRKLTGIVQDDCGMFELNAYNCCVSFSNLPMYTLPTSTADHNTMLFKHYWQYWDASRQSSNSGQAWRHIEKLARPRSCESAVWDPHRNQQHLWSQKRAKPLQLNQQTHTSHQVINLNF